MPKLSQKLTKDVKRYIRLRFDHMGETWIEARIKKVIRALKNESAEVRKNYSVDVENFFSVNEEVLAMADKTHAEQTEHPAIQKMLQMSEVNMKQLIRKHQGNMNAIAEELYNGNNNK